MTTEKVTTTEATQFIKQVRDLAFDLIAKATKIESKLELMAEQTVAKLAAPVQAAIVVHKKRGRKPKSSPTDSATGTSASNIN